MRLGGKGFFTWNLRNCEGGNAQRIASRAADAGLSHVLIKVADGTNAFGEPGLNRAVTNALRARGIRVWGWHYVYGKEPAGEAFVAVNQARALGLDGYCVDAEGEYTAAGNDAAARVFMTELRGGLPDTPVALSSYRYPRIHTIPWTIFLERCDYSMPQVYWERAHDPDSQLKRSTAEYLALDPPRPVVPTGAAYGAGNWEATPQEVHGFLRTANDLGLAGANFYSWDYAGAPGRTALWDAVATFDWPPGPEDDGTGDAGDQPRDDSIVSAYFDALNSFDVDAILSLYQPNAGHVTGQRTISGTDALRSWYDNLLHQQLRSGAFTLTRVEGNGSYRRFSWAADSFTGHVEDGDDTIGLREGLIQYHYTYFTVSR